MRCVQRKRSRWAVALILFIIFHSFSLGYYCRRVLPTAIINPFQTPKKTETHFLSTIGTMQVKKKSWFFKKDIIEIDSLIPFLFYSCPFFPYIALAA